MSKYKKGDEVTFCRKNKRLGKGKVKYPTSACLMLDNGKMIDKNSVVAINGKEITK